MSVTEAPKDAKAQAKADKAYAKATRPWYQKKRFWLLGIIVLIAIFSLATSGDDGSTTDAATASSSQETADGSDAPAADEPAEEPAEEAPIVVTAQDMIEELESNALAASTKYSDKRVTVTGKLDNIDASGDYFSLTGTDEFTFTGVQIYIDDSQVETVSGFTMGQDVTVTGPVTDVGEILGYSIDAESIG